jgi:prefoldin subunit 5
MNIDKIKEEIKQLEYSILLHQQHLTKLQQNIQQVANLIIEKQGAINALKWIIENDTPKTSNKQK